LAFFVFDLRKELNQTAPRFYDPSIRSKSVHPWASAEIFPGGGNFAYLFQVAADANAMQIVIDTTLYYTFCPISVCWL